MKGKLWTFVAAGLVAGAPALAGLNPADPGLPTVTDSNIFGGGIANNQLSAMCLDCHTQIPKAGGGSHYASATAGETNSGGSGIDNTGAITTRDSAQYFRLTAWENAVLNTNNAYSKYGDAANTLSKMIDNVTNPTATTDATAANYTAYELICESCHNIIVNDAGGNNLLDVNDDGTNVDWQDVAEASLCVGCHGFMYTDNAANGTAPANANWSDSRNDDHTGSKRGNNEYHWVWNPSTNTQEPYAQNHHVMTGDNIDNIRAGAGILWTDNLIVSYTDTPIDNTSTKGTYPVGSAWTGSVTKPTNSGHLSCTNCHAPAHGGDVTEGASILRGTSLNGAATSAIDRISDRNAWKRFSDVNFCGQCHK